MRPVTLDKSVDTKVYWGDTHIHTNLSSDAYPNGNLTLGPTEAYRFARGEMVTTDTGIKVKLQRPLDFVVVADHAFGMGVVRDVDLSASELLRTKSGSRLVQAFKEFKAGAMVDQVSIDAFFMNMWKMSPDGVDDSLYRQSIWGEVTNAADTYNNPGSFTTFSGYEWSGYERSNGVATFHRVVIFKDGADKVNEILPFSQLDSNDPEDLWSYLEDYQKLTGGEVLAIPHNPNLSNGRMFSSTRQNREAIDLEYARTRSRWEPLVEVTQMKGDSETHPILSPQDEFSDFETWHSLYAKKIADKYNGQFVNHLAFMMSFETKKGEYARSGLKGGLHQQSRLGVNPFKFGMIGSTDAHTGLSTGDENYFLGKMAKDEPSPERILNQKSAYLSVRGWEYSSGGYAAVWAEKNTREALFAAMKRKEVYATTGPRITVRFFGGWHYQIDDAYNSDLAAIGYTKGVPMGGDLSQAPKGSSPRFLIRVIKDPDGANLDRVQVIKGWLTKAGELKEKVYDVALSDGRSADTNGNVKSVGSTVDIDSATYTNSIGVPELAVVWMDPDFKPDELSFYYLRAIEIPTPRWTAYDANRFQVKAIPKDVPMVIQERAYSSPIWYTPW